jgi:hypothetical protein
MICSYCQQELEPIVYVDQEEGCPSFSEHYHCKECATKFYTIRVTGHIFQTSIRSGNYKLVLNKDNGRCSLFQGEPGKFEGIMGTYWNTVLHLDCTPQNITPQTIADKIKMMLVFL